MSSTFHDPGRSFTSEHVPQPSFVTEVAPTAARGGARREAVRVRGAALPPSGAPLTGRHACASEEADFLLQVSGTLAGLRTAIARWRTAPPGALRDLRRGEVERRQESLVALLWAASRVRLSHNEWCVVERLLERERDAMQRLPGGEHAAAIELA